MSAVGVIVAPGRARRPTRPRELVRREGDAAKAVDAPLHLRVGIVDAGVDDRHPDPLPHVSCGPSLGRVDRVQVPLQAEQWSGLGRVLHRWQHVGIRLDESDVLVERRNPLHDQVARCRGDAGRVSELRGAGVV